MDDNAVSSVTTIVVLLCRSKTFTLDVAYLLNIGYMVVAVFLDDWSQFQNWKESYNLKWEHNSGFLSWSQLTNTKSILLSSKSFLADFFSCLCCAEYAFEFCFVSFFIKSSKENVIGSVFKSIFACCVTFKTCSAPSDVTKYSRNFELYLQYLLVFLKL